MVKDLAITHPMYPYASHWFIFNYTNEMKLADLLDFFELVSGLDGGDWEEISLKHDGYDPGLKGSFLAKSVTKGKDWYWCWSAAAHDRTQIDVFLTTEKQVSYFALATTADWEKGRFTTNDILNKIRSRKNKIRLNNGKIHSVNPTVAANKILEKIKGRSKAQREKKL